MAIYQMYRAKNFKPDLIVMGVDPWNLNRFAGSERWQSVRSEYEQLEGSLHQAPARRVTRLQAVTGSKYAQMVSPSYLQYSLKTELTRPPTAAGYRATIETDDAHLSGLTRLADGSVIYARSYRTKPAELARSEALEFGRQPTLSRAFTELDPVAMRKFEAFLDLLTLDGSKVVLVLSPFHPSAYRVMRDADPNAIVERAETYFAGVAHAKHLDYVGSFNPATVCLGESDFYDAYHPNDAAIDLIMRRQTCAR
jgi:hypothetical protein